MPTASVRCRRDPYGRETGIERRRKFLDFGFGNGMGDNENKGMEQESGIEFRMELTSLRVFGFGCYIMVGYNQYGIHYYHSSKTENRLNDNELKFRLKFTYR